MSRIITQGVHTIYYGPTNTKGARIKTTAWADSLWFNYDYALNADQNHVRAAQGFFDAKGWKGEFVTGYYHVQINEVP